CRSCRDITIDSLINCPTKGHTCDEREPLSAAVLSASDPCRCQSLRCANKGWRLAVNGIIVDKVRCKEGQWFSSGLAASSFVCAVPTDPGIPATPKPLICPKLEQASLADCQALAGGGRICVLVPVIQEPEFACAAGYRLYIKQTNGAATGVDKLVCNPVSKMWEANLDPADGTAVAVACHP
ncbi:hypothetical protein PENTCL1PPCAC_9720, partial [Pristionchus entomophagus]